MIFHHRKIEAPPPAANRLRLRPPAGFGDHLMFSSLLPDLLAARPGAELVVAANHPEIFHGNPYVATCLAERDLKRGAPRELESFLPVRFRQPEERRGQTAGHLIDDMRASLGLPPGDHRPQIYLTEEELRAAAQAVAPLPAPRLAIAPYGKTNVRLPNKLYPAPLWRRLGEMLAAEGLRPVQLGARSEGPLLPGAYDLRDAGFRASAAVLQQCALLVTHVGGLMHLARAAGTRSLVIYGGAEHPAISGYGENINLYSLIDCASCWMEEACSHLTCMQMWPPERVLRLVMEALDR